MTPFLINNLYKNKNAIRFMKNLTILWLDDERDPEVYLKQKSNSGAFLRTSEFYKKNIFNKYDVSFIWCRNYDEFTKHIEKNGLPEFISFDRDLKKGNKIPKGTDYPDGEDCAKWLKDYCKKHGKKLPKYFVHSANKNGQINIPQILGDDVMENKKLIFHLIAESKELDGDTKRMLKDFLLMLFKCFKDVKKEELLSIFSKR